MPWHDLAVLGRLRRFAAGRARGVPGFVVLAGPVAQSLALWQAWQAERGTGTILTGHAGREDAIRACPAGMLAGRDVARDVAALLAPGLLGRMDEDELAGRLARQGRPERVALLRGLEHAVDARLLDVCRSLLVDHTEAGLAAEAGTLTLMATLQSGALPALLVVEPAPAHDAAPAPQAAGSAWLAEAAATALYLGEVVPGLLGGVAAEHARVHAYLAAGPAAQVAARVHAGLIAVSPTAPAAPAASPDPSPDLARAPWVRRGLEQEQVAPAVLVAFDEAVRLLQQVDASPHAPAETRADMLDRARRQAESTLHAYLAGHPETAGLFELNGRMPFDFGNRRAEVDLVCRQLGVAVEIDGYYHFRDPDGFRRDRRKDVLLQSHGFLVMRVLAGDVVARLIEIMTQILDVVRMQRRRLGQPEQ